MRKKILREYEYLFNGSKRYCDFTNEEKKIYQEFMRNHEKQREKQRVLVSFIISVVALLLSLTALIVRVLK